MRLCAQEGCAAKHYGRGFCKLHWRRAKFGGDMSAPVRRTTPPERRDGPCEVEGCRNIRKVGRLCDGHYFRKKFNHPDPLGPLRTRRKNGARAARRKAIGTLDAELVERLGRIAKSYGLPVVVLIEDALNRTFPRRNVEAA